jgi:prepilin-type N-terminal cleavage/methylation domain-containing protein
MHDRIRKARENEGGFTLIELLIVIVILGILAGVVIFASLGFKNKGATEACKTTVSSVKTAIEAYHVDDPNALFPLAYTGIDPTYFDGNGVTATVAAGVTTVKGKGWNFPVTFGAAVVPAAVPAGSAAPPTYGACVIV